MTREDVILSLLNSGELEIDSDGRIWRLARRGGNPQRNFAIRPCDRIRAEYMQRQGYLLITTTIAGVKTTASAHRVIWTHFNGAIPARMTINHKNGVKGDNRPGNLELATMSQQRAHAVSVLNVNRNHPTGSKNPRTVLTETDVLAIRALRSEGMMVKDIAAKYAMDPRAISAITTRRNWRHI